MLGVKSSGMGKENPVGMPGSHCPYPAGHLSRMAPSPVPFPGGPLFYEPPVHYRLRRRCDSRFVQAELLRTTSPGIPAQGAGGAVYRRETFLTRTFPVSAWIRSRPRSSAGVRSPPPLCRPSPGPVSSPGGVAHEADGPRG